MNADTLIAAGAAVVTAALIGFSLRRLALMFASLTPSRHQELEPDSALPSVTLIIAAHNESIASESLVTALDALGYPSERLSVVLVSDGSTDATAAFFSHWTSQRKHARTIVLAERVGKARALNEALASVSSEVVAVLDADMRPRPDYLRRLLSAFRDPAVGGVAGFISPHDPAVTAVTRYAAVESWVHQLVTSAGKDRLGLNPPTLGASAYRWEALQHIGFFHVVPYGVDVAVTVALTRAGWTTRFVPEAVVETGVVRTLPEYCKQHVRWSRGSLNAFAPGTGCVESRSESTRSPPVVGRGRALARRIEVSVLCAGYLDRIALLAAMALAAASALPLWVPACYLTFPALETIAALHRAGVRGRSSFLLSTAAMFPVDAIASAAGALLHLARRPARWDSPSRRAPAAGVEIHGIRG